MGIFTLVFPPSSVGASKSPPKAAVVIVIGILQKRSFPSLSKIECFPTSIKIYKSPDCPPLIPASPSPASLILVPVSTPGGMLTLSFFDFSTLPCPLHKRQGFFMIWPLPEQVGQVLSTVKKPCCALTFPIPEQVGHEVGLAPD